VVVKAHRMITLILLAQAAAQAEAVLEAQEPHKQLQMQQVQLVKDMMEELDNTFLEVGHLVAVAAVLAHLVAMDLMELVDLEEMV